MLCSLSAKPSNSEQILNYLIIWNCKTPKTELRGTLLSFPENCRLLMLSILLML